MQWKPPSRPASLEGGVCFLRGPHHAVRENHSMVQPVGQCLPPEVTADGTRGPGAKGAPVGRARLEQGRQLGGEVRVGLGDPVVTKHPVFDGQDGLHMLGRDSSIHVAHPVPSVPPRSPDRPHCGKDSAGLLPEATIGMRRDPSRVVRRRAPVRHTGARLRWSRDHPRTRPVRTRWSDWELCVDGWTVEGGDQIESHPVRVLDLGIRNQESGIRNR